MNVRTLATWIGLSLALAPGPAAATEPPPNVVVILADDLGWGDVGFNGRTEWATPNLDRLAGQGTVFKRWYTAAVVCAPSRAAMLTGKATIHNGVSRNDADLPASEVTLAEALKARGYATGLFGKWHHGKPRAGEKTYVHPMDQGFDEFFGFTDAVHAWEKFPEKLWDGRAMKPVSGYADDLFTSTHFNIEAPEDEVARHRGKFAGTEKDSARPRGKFAGTEKDSARPLNATYAAMVTRLDRNVGRLLAAVDTLGLTDKTMVVFTSDHGATFEQGNQGASAFHDSNRPFRGQKRTLWEGGIRVPAVVRWPGHVPAGEVVDYVVQMTDLFPSVLTAAGGRPDPSWKVDGRDILYYWTSHPHEPCAPAAPGGTQFWEWRGEGSNQLAAMQGRFKLVITNGGRPELFDVEADPAERRNVVAEHPDLAKRLGAELKAWLATERAD